METGTASIFDKAPAIIEASAKSPLALAALIILVVGFLAFFYFKEAKEVTRTIIFIIIGLGAFTLLFAILAQVNPAQNPVTTPKGELPTPPKPGDKPLDTPERQKGQPQVALGSPVISHGATTPRGPGISISVPGAIRDAQGETAQLVINFTFANGAPVWANPQETQFRTTDGLVATGTVPFQVPTDSYDLNTLPVSIPYYAFNLVATGGYTRFDLLLTAAVYLNGVTVARSSAVPFYFFW